jgi:hypothetical protein
MALAHIGSRVTFDTNIEHLERVGLIQVSVFAGEHEGNEYEVFVPEEIETLPSMTRQSSHTGQSSHAPKQHGLDTPESSQTRQTSSAEGADTYAEPKTSFKTKEEKTDDEAFAPMIALLRQAAKEVTGRETTSTDAARWNDVAELLVTELKIAAARTNVSSAPAFLAEHLRRRLRKRDARQIEREVSEAASGVALAPATAKPDLTHEEIEEQAGLLANLMMGGATMPELEEQFSGNFRANQWHQIRSIALANHGYTQPRPAAQPDSDGDDQS